MAQFERVLGVLCEEIKHGSMTCHIDQIHAGDRITSQTIRNVRVLRGFGSSLADYDAKLKRATINAGLVTTPRRRIVKEQLTCDVIDMNGRFLVCETQKRTKFRRKRR